MRQSVSDLQNHQFFQKSDADHHSIQIKEELSILVKKLHDEHQSTHQAHHQDAFQSSTGQNRSSFEFFSPTYSIVSNSHASHFDMNQLKLNQSLLSSPKKEAPPQQNQMAPVMNNLAIKPVMNESVSWQKTQSQATASLLVVQVPQEDESLMSQSMRSQQILKNAQNKKAGEGSHSPDIASGTQNPNSEERPKIDCERTLE